MAQHLYTVQYKRYDGFKEVGIVAATLLKALERARVIIRKKEYSDREITAINRQQEIDGVAK